MLVIATRTRTGDLVHARRECNPLLYRGFLFKLMNYQIYIIHSLNLDRKTLNLTFKIDPNKMVKQIKGVGNLFMLYQLSNVWKLLLMLEQIRALRPGKKVNLATEEGCAMETCAYSEQTWMSTFNRYIFLFLDHLSVMYTK